MCVLLQLRIMWVDSQKKKKKKKKESCGQFLYIIDQLFLGIYDYHKDVNQHDFFSNGKYTFFFFF